MIKKSFTFSISLLAISFFLSACYYDNGEELYQHGVPTTCDTLSVSYTAFVKPLIDQLCINCHSGTTLSGNINLEDYGKVQTVIGNGRLIGAVSHSPGFSPMPKGGTKIPTCEIEKLTAWINQGAKNN